MDVNRSKRARIHWTTEPGLYTRYPRRLRTRAPSTGDTRRLSRVVMVNPSRHGIVYNPPDSAADDWIEELFAAHLADHLGFDQPMPDWSTEHAVTVIPATRPTATSLHPDARPFGSLAVVEGLLGGRAVAAAPFTDWRDTDTQKTVGFADFNVPGTDRRMRSRSLDFQFRRNASDPQPEALTTSATSADEAPKDS